MLGQPASWQTVCRPSRLTRPRSWVYSGPIFALTLIHGGFRSIGVSALRASIRSMRRPSGWTVVTWPAYAAYPAARPQRDERHELRGAVGRRLVPKTTRATTGVTNPPARRPNEAAPDRC